MAVHRHDVPCTPTAEEGCRRMTGELLYRLEEALSHPGICRGPGSPRAAGLDSCQRRNDIGSSTFFGGVFQVPHAGIPVHVQRSPGFLVPRDTG